MKSINDFNFCLKTCAVMSCLSTGICPGKVCIAKFQNLRTYYRNEKKKLSSFRSGTDARDFVPKWDHFVRLQFLDDTIKSLDSISNLDYMELEINAVCELHFSDDAIRRYTEAYEEKTGQKIYVPLKRFRLENFAVPTIFTDFPTYLSNSGNPTRECSEQRLQRLENEHLQR
ncbi:hypothetical protein TNCV_2670961 [Trichonephila clavipes]|nr:hypothetical protein TNCV_2670961 [Trichonephila clavipes]